MPKISNIRFANQKVFASSEHLEFDKDGVAEVKSEQLYNELLGLEGYHAVRTDDSDKDDKKDKDDNKDKDTKKDDKKEEPKKDDKADKDSKKDTKSPAKDASKK